MYSSRDKHSRSAAVDDNISYKHKQSSVAATHREIALT